MCTCPRYGPAGRMAKGLIDALCNQMATSCSITAVPRFGHQTPTGFLEPTPYSRTMGTSLSTALTASTDLHPTPISSYGSHDAYARRRADWGSGPAEETVRCGSFATLGGSSGGPGGISALTTAF